MIAKVRGRFYFLRSRLLRKGAAHLVFDKRPRRRDWSLVVTMRDFPSCFGESGVQVADCSPNSGKTAQNLVTCLYQAQLRGRSCLITVAWSKHMTGQALSVGIDDFADRCLCKLDVKPWLFSKWKGSKSFEVDGGKVEIFWDLSAAKFGAGPEPLGGFFVAVLFDLEMALLLGDLTMEAYSKTGTRPPISNAFFIAKREHVYGKKVFFAKARFSDNGRSHDLAIECDTVGLKDPCLEIHVDKKRVLHVKHLAWKFRGNQTVVVDGIPVEVFWDVYNWFFGSLAGNAVFMFRTSQSNDKLLVWDSQMQSLSFSLILYAWRNE